MNWQRLPFMLFANSASSSLLFNNQIPGGEPSFASVGFWSTGPKRGIFPRFIFGAINIPAILRTKAIETFMSFCYMGRALIRSRAVFTNQLDIWHQSYSSILAWFKRSVISFWRGSPSIHLNYHFDAATSPTAKTPSLYQRCRYIKASSAGRAEFIDSVFGAHLQDISAKERRSLTGSGTVGQVALELGRRAVLIELNLAYVELAHDRTNVTPGFL